MTVFVVLHLYISISLHFIVKVKYFLFLFVCFFFIGHTASFCGRGVGKKCTWRKQGCLGCSSQSGGGVRRPKGKTAKMAEQLKEAVKERDSAKVGLKTTERQFEEVRKELHYSETNLATEK